MAQNIIITGFKGGTGATTFAVWLGRALAASGERTLIVDGDDKCGCAEIIGNCRDRIVYTLADYAKSACRAKQTLVSHPKDANLSFMPTLGLTDFSAVKRAIADVDGLFDYILADKTGESCCDRALIVTEPYPASIKSADACRSYLTDGGIKDVALVVNKLSAAAILNGETMTAHEIASLLHLRLAAVIPEDLLIAADRPKPATVKAYKAAAENITGKRESVFNVFGGMGGVNGYFKRKLRQKI